MTRTTTIAILGAGALGLGVLVGFTPAQPSTASQPAGDGAAFEIDPVHSAIVFKIEHLGVSHFYGRFNQFSGEFDLADGGSISVTVPVESIDTNNDTRDNHLRSPDFFNAKQFPDLTFTSTSMKADGEDTYTVKGDLTMLGTTRPIELTVHKVGEKDAGARFGYRAGFAGEVTIKRSDFGMTYGIDNGVLGDEVTFMIGLEGAKR